MGAGGPVCTCCGFSCWRVFSNGQSDLGLWRFFGAIVIFVTKFVLDLGMVRTEEFLNIWGVFGMLALFLYKSMFLDDFLWGLISCEDE